MALLKMEMEGYTELSHIPTSKIKTTYKCDLQTVVQFQKLQLLEKLPTTPFNFAYIKVVHLCKHSKLYYAYHSCTMHFRHICPLQSKSTSIKTKTEETAVLIIAHENLSS
jgi:hypothetical protein